MSARPEQTSSIACESTQFLLFDGRQGTLDGRWEPLYSCRKGSLSDVVTQDSDPAVSESEQQPELWTHKQLYLRFPELQDVTGAGHVHVQATTAAPLYREAAASLPDVLCNGRLVTAAECRAFLASRAPVLQLAALSSSIGHVLRRPVAIVGGCFDVGHDPMHARGNGMGQLFAALAGVESLRGRTAQRYFEEAPADVVVRIPQMSKERRAGKGRRWKAPKRIRKDGRARRTSEKEYDRRFIPSITYVKNKVLKGLYRCPELAPLRAALAKLIGRDHRWREHARFLGCNDNRRIGYWHRIKRSRSESSAHRERRANERARTRSFEDETKRQQAWIVANYYSQERSEQKGRGLSPPVISGGSARPGAPPGRPAAPRETERSCPGASPRVEPCPIRLATSPQTALPRTNDPDVGSLSPADARAHLRALLGAKP